LSAVTTGADGQWSTDLGPIAGTIEVDVEGDRSAPLRLIVDGLTPGEQRDPVEVTPISELVVAYGEYLISSGLSEKDALTKSRRLIEAHFAGLDAERIVPAALDSSLRSLSPEATDALLLVGLDSLADQIAQMSGLLPSGAVSVWDLVSALSSDIRADGVFDGKGIEGALRLGSVDLDGDTLRAAYGRALLLWLDSSANTTLLRRIDLEPLAASIANDASEIFPAGSPAPLVDVGPMITRFVVRSGYVEVLDHAPVNGRPIVEVAATSALPIASLTLEVEDAPDGVVELIEDQPGYGTWRIDSTMLSDGPRSLRVTARDARGRAVERDRGFVFDNTPPVLTATAAGLSNSPIIRVIGTATDAIGPIASITLAGGGSSSEVRSPGDGTFTATIAVPCEATWPIVVSVSDAAGNVASKTVVVRCDDTAPTIGQDPSPFRQESTLSATYTADGQRVDYSWAPGQGEVTFLDRVQTATLTKYFSRLDASSDNLPTYRFWANDTEGGVHVEYRTLLNQTVERTWQPLSPLTVGPDRTEFALAVSYQSVGTSLGSGSSTDLHQIELRAIDDAGNTKELVLSFHVALLSPPVWFGHCRIDPSLSAYTLPGLTLDAAYRQPALPVFVGEIRYALSLSPSSLAPVGALLATFAPQGAFTRVTQISEDRHDGPVSVQWTDINLWCAPDLWRGTTKIGPDAMHLSACTVPETPPDQISFAATPGGAANDLTPHAFIVSASDSSGAALVAQASGALPFPPDDALGTVRIALDHPEITFGGAVYDWNTSFVVPDTYTVRAEPLRYRISNFDRVGYNYEQNATTDWLTYPFVTRGYLSAVEIDVATVETQAENAALPNVPVAVQVMPECQSSVTYVTRL
jgi:hypothetical protein